MPVLHEALSEILNSNGLIKHSLFLAAGIYIARRMRTWLETVWGEGRDIPS
jgi:hypothetical protein